MIDSSPVPPSNLERLLRHLDQETLASDLVKARLASVDADALRRVIRERLEARRSALAGSSS
jgi:hypothetical protein